MNKGIKLQQVGRNINFKIDDGPLTTVVSEKSIGDKLYRLAFLYNQNGLPSMKEAFLREIETYKASAKSAPVEKYVEKNIKKTMKKFNISSPIVSEKAKQHLMALKEKGESYAHYMKFLNLLYTNPIKDIRDVLLDVVIKNKLPITSKGYIVGVRQVYKIGNSKASKQAELRDFVQSEVFKVKKKWKKSVNKYAVYQLGEKYSLVESSEKVDSAKEGNFVGLLASLEKQFVGTTEEKVLYTDAHTRKMRWSIGDVCSIPRSFTNTQLTCGSQMLHIRTNPKDLSGFGDTDILVLINPRDVISAKEPNWKIGVCEFYFAAILDKAEIPSIFDKELSVFENQYEQKNNVNFEKDILPTYQGEFDKKLYADIVANRVEWI